MILLDTHAWVWWTIDPYQLSETQRREIIESEEDLIGVSAISCLGDSQALRVWTAGTSCWTARVVPRWH